MKEFFEGLKHIIRRLLNVIEYALYVAIIIGNIIAPFVDFKSYSESYGYASLLGIPVVFILRQLINYVFSMSRYEEFDFSIQK